MDVYANAALARVENAIGDLTRDVHALRAEVRPTPTEVDDLLARVGLTSYASEAMQVVEDWIESRFGVVGAATAALREREALRPVPA